MATVKRNKRQWSELVGSYTPITLDATTLFLNSNKFWYSAGTTTMKGLRAYFDFYDVLTEVEDEYSVKMRIGDVITGINGLATVPSAGEGAVYNVNGQRMQTLQKGINIVNGKKVMVK